MTQRTDREKAVAYAVDLPGDRKSVTVTFKYARGDLRTLVAVTRQEAFDQARARWGDGWIGEPVVSTPRSIYYDITGITRARIVDHYGLKSTDKTANHKTRLRRQGRL